MGEIMILVTAKVNPDLDGVACTLTYADFLNQKGEKIKGIVFGEPQSEVQYFIQKQNIEIPHYAENFNDKWDSFILVDASSMKGMPIAVKAENVIEIIDHRTSEPQKEFPNAKIQNELIGAAATLIVEKFIKGNLKPKLDHAKLLYGAIYHNTLNFTSTNTSERDIKAAEFLEKEFNLDKSLIQKMFKFATAQIEFDVEKALKDDAKEFGTGYKIGAYQLIVYSSKVLDRKINTRTY